MKKSAYKIFIVFFLVQFLLWMQLGAAQLYCQCEHSIAEASCHVSQDKSAEDGCCENPQAPKIEDNHNQTPMVCHEMATEGAGAMGSSCCLDDSESGEATVVYLSSMHYCQTACVNIVTSHSKQVTMPHPGKKMQYLPLPQKVGNRNFTVIEVLLHSTFHKLEISPHSQPLFLMHRSLLN